MTRALVALLLGSLWTDEGEGELRELSGQGWFPTERQGMMSGGLPRRPTPPGQYVSLL